MIGQYHFFKLRLALWPVGVVYWFVVGFRNRLFDWGVFKTYKSSACVISVGNLTTGGTGKTPVLVALSQILKDSRSLAVLTRGYGGQVRSGEVRTVDLAKSDPASEFGDEPTLLKYKLENIPVVVAPQRVAGAKFIESKAQVLLLDDGFQHRWLARNLDVLLIDVSVPLDRYRIFPVGNLRESIEGVKRASFVFLTRISQANPETLGFFKSILVKNKISYGSCDFKILTFMPYSHWLARGETAGHSSGGTGVADTGTGDDHPPLDESGLRGRELLLVSAIGNPDGFTKGIEAQGFRVREHLIFRDHHFFSYSDLSEIYRTAGVHGLRDIVITEKDAVKWSHLISEKRDSPGVIDTVRIWVAELGVVGLNENDEFRAVLSKTIN